MISRPKLDRRGRADPVLVSVLRCRRGRIEKIEDVDLNLYALGDLVADVEVDLLVSGRSQRIVRHQWLGAEPAQFGAAEPWAEIVHDRTERDPMKFGALGI